ncbi:MAG: hypothetical protein IKJ37_01530 [Kiritimatiellae bacterium]|nr:hypothetical protein [Kiritimatiellia bacterium]
MLKKLTVLSFTAGLMSAAFAGGSDILINPAFENVQNGRPAGWALTGRFRAERDGHNGSGGLVWDSTGSDGKTHRATQKLNGVHPGDTINITALVKKDGFDPHGGHGAVLSVEWHDADNKWIKAIYGLTKKLPDGRWSLVSTSGLMPENAKSAVMVIYVSGSSTGRVAWDNISVTKSAPKPVEFVATSVYRNLAVDGKADFHAAINVPHDAADEVSAVFSWRDAAGAVRRAKADRMSKDEAFIELDVAGFAMGTQDVKCELVAGGKVLGSASSDFTRVDRLPERRVWIDRHRRCIVDGKPFFPLGMYWLPNLHDVPGGRDGKQLDWYTNGPFNCVIHYTMWGRKELDFCHSIGLKALNPINRDIRACLWGRAKKPYTKEEAKRELIGRVRAVKDHPALLGWYIGDELDAASVPYQQDLYRIMKSVDDQHPIYGVQDRTYDLRPFTMTFDVLGLDPYPVCKNPVSMVTKMMREADVAIFRTRPHWGVPQTFSWQWFREREQNTERFPSLAELRSMFWQFIANGANGLLPYAYNVFFYPLNKDDWRPRFVLVCEAAREVAKMSDVLLSVEDAPKGLPNTGDAVCRTWMKDGLAYVLVCNLAERPVDVSVALSSGRWKMDGVEVGTPATMDGEAKVNFYLDSIGVSLVRLAPRN